MIKKVVSAFSWREINRLFRIDVSYFIQGGSWSLLSDGVQQGTAIVATLLITRMAGMEMLGQYQLALSLLATVAVVSVTGIDTVIMRDVARGKEGVFKKALQTRMRWSWLSLPLFIAVAAYYWLLDQIGLSLSFMVLALLSPWYYVLLSWRNLFKGKKLFAAHAKFSMARSVIILAGIAASLFLFPGSVGALVAAFLVGHILVNGVAIIVGLSSLKNGKVSHDWREYSYFLSRVGLLKILISNIDKIIVGVFFSPAVLALYFIGIVIPNSLIMLMKSMLNTVLPKLSKRQALSFWELGLALIIGCLATFVSLILVTYLTVPLFGHEYTEAIKLARIASLALIFLPLSQLLMNFAFMNSRRKVVFFSQVGSPMIKLLLLIALGSIWKLEGFVIVFAAIPLVWTVIILINLNIDFSRKIVVFAD